MIHKIESITTKRILRHELKYPTDGNKVVCPYCGKILSSYSYMQQHINIHLNLRPYNCSICNKNFGMKSTLRSHLRAHRNEKPHQCKIDNCNRYYWKAIDVRRHQFKIHGIRNECFPCTVCSKLYPDEKRLREHMNSHGRPRKQTKKNKRITSTVS